MSRDAVMASLEQVNDPHVPVSLRRMGMLAGVDIVDDKVTVSIGVPCLACPATDMLRADARKAVLSVDGVTQVEVHVAWGADWRREHIDPVAHPLLRHFGLQI